MHKTYQCVKNHALKYDIHADPMTTRWKLNIKQTEVKKKSTSTILMSASTLKKGRP